MSRPLRLEFSGAFYHITSRGDGREAIYLSEDDFHAFISLLGEVCGTYNWRCHAYCLMTNHYHLMIETPDANLSQGMRQLNGVYTQGFNRRHKRVGHVFQGRYKGILVDADAYLMELSRYVVLNPVRARMVKAAGEWRWSSYHCMIGKQECPAWLELDYVLSRFSNSRQQAQMQYIEYVSVANNQSNIWKNLRNQIYLGDKKFVQRLQAYIEAPLLIDEVPLAQRRERAKPLSYYCSLSSDRKKAMQAAYATGQYSLKAIGDYFCVHYSTVSRVVNNRLKTT